uniref:Uncharacterized protein n=1 Tax=Kuenenia stuttgartiensis TaxID=174633 RepID=Q1Q0K7_KUEST|nr:unknown protein [Candidatus Kuenenia stuttgartiensis]
MDEIFQRRGDPAGIEDLQPLLYQFLALNLTSIYKAFKEIHLLFACICFCFL